MAKGNRFSGWPKTIHEEKGQNQPSHRLRIGSPIKRGDVMKNLLSFVLVGASLLVASAAQAQEIRLRANVPFEFVVGDKAYPAGSYRIDRVTQDEGVLLLENADGLGLAMVLSDVCDSATPSNSTKLVFHRVGDTYSLFQIWVEGQSTGRELPQSKQERTPQLARNGEKSEDVIVAANFIK
jgi:hypothetical protein